MKKERKVSKEMKSPSKPPRTERKAAHSKKLVQAFAGGKLVLMIKRKA